MVTGIIIGVIAGLIAGGTVSYLLWDKVLKSKKVKLITEAETEAEVIKKEKMLQAREKYLQLKSEHEKYLNEKNQRMVVLILTGGISPWLAASSLF